MTIRELSASSGLSSFESSQLLEWLLGWNHSAFLLHQNDTPPAQIVARFQALARKRQTGYPLQYLLGEWDFFGLTFSVGEGVLIPRSDTELLVETGLRLLSGQPAPQVCDLCSGSGCIPIALAKNLPKNASLTAVELSDEAFSYLLHNIARHHCTNLHPIQADVTVWTPMGFFDCILSNPPYLTDAEITELQCEVTYEPKMALLAAEEGLLFYKIITKRYRNFLRPGGSLIFEVGYRQAEAVAAILEENSYDSITILPDRNGINRVVTATTN